MSLESKVVWSEGMFLNPQHFQQQQRYFERFIDNRCSALHACGWGLRSFELDRQLLALGKLSLKSAEGVFPDGTPFSFPSCDEAPPVLNVPSDTRGAVVYLAVPVRRSGGIDVLPEDSKQSLARHYIAEQSVRDDTLEGGETQSVQVGKLRLRLLLGSDDLSGYTCIALCRVDELRQETEIALDDRFIATVLDCQAAAPIAGFVNELHGMLRQRANAIAGRLGDARRGGTAEIADYLLLQLINRAEPLVEHFGQCARLHPLPLYEYFLQLTGDLSTFMTSERRPPSLPRYTHGDLQHSFLPVMQTLRSYLSKVYEQTAIAMPLVQKKYGIYVAEVGDRSLLASASFVLAVRADVSDEVVRSHLPAQMKIGPVERIRQLVNAALPGIALKALPVAPRQIPYRSGYSYFELEKSGQYWQEMSRSGGFAMHAGGDFPGLEMEFWAIRQ